MARRACAIVAVAVLAAIGGVTARPLAGTGSGAPRVSLRASLSDTNLVTVAWEVHDGGDPVDPEVDIEPAVGRRPTRCDGTDGCQASVRTPQSGVLRYTITVRSEVGLTQSSTEVTVPRPPSPVVDAHLVRIDPFSDAPQELSWSRPRSVPPSSPRATDYVRVRRSDLVVPLDRRFPVTGSYRIDRPEDRATVLPVTWSIEYCRQPEVDAAALCSLDQDVTFDPRPARFEGPFRRFVEPGEDVELAWVGPGDRWLVDAPRLGLHDELVGDRSITIPGTSLIEGAHAVTVQACQGACAPVDPRRDPRDRVQLVVGLASQRPDWTERDLAEDFSVDRIDLTERRTTGAPLDVAFGADGELWSLGEFGTDPAWFDGRELTHLETPYRPRTVTGDDGIVRRERVRPFGNPLGTCVGASSATPALAERLIWTGDHVWFTHGGSIGQPCDDANLSRLLRFDPEGQDDPHTEGDDRFCAVAVPGDGNHVIGVAHDPGTDRIWFTEADLDRGEPHGSLSWFLEDEIGCENRLDYENPAALAAAEVRNTCATMDDPGCIRRIALSQSDHEPPLASHPTHLVVDEDDGYVWLADFAGGVLSRYPLDGGRVEQFPLAAPSATWSSVGALAWQIRVTDDAVYVVEYQDNQVLRFDKTVPDLATACADLVDGANPCVDEVFLPVGSSTVNAHSIDLDGDRLWFTAANEALGVSDHRDAYVGYLDRASWASGETPGGVIYTDLYALGPPPEGDHRSPRGIDVEEGTGRVALAEMGGEIVLLTPTGGT